MQAFYPLLTLFSIVLFVWLGRRLAAARHRNRMAWGLAGAALPPVLLVLLLLRPLTPEEADEDEGGHKSDPA